MSKRLRIAEQWDQFARAVLAKDSPPLQRKEMRRAFYAGAHAGLFEVLKGLTEPAEPAEEDLQFMRDLDTELKEFAHMVKDGRA